MSLGETMTKRGKKERAERFISVKSLAMMGMLSAVAAILMIFEIPLWFAPHFYKLDFSEVPVLIGAFTLGPIAGVIIEFIKIILNLFINGSITVGVGEFANFAIGCSYVIPAAIIYKYNKTKQSAIVGMIFGIISLLIVGSLINAYVMLPFYAKLSGQKIEDFINMGKEVNFLIKDLRTFIIFAVAPFNLIKGVVVSVIVIPLYKRLSTLIKSFTHK